MEHEIFVMDASDLSVQHKVLAKAGSVRYRCASKPSTHGCKVPCDADSTNSCTEFLVIQNIFLCVL